MLNRYKIFIKEKNKNFHENLTKNIDITKMTHKQSKKYLKENIYFYSFCMSDFVKENQDYFINVKNGTRDENEFIEVMRFDSFISNKFRDEYFKLKLGDKVLNNNELIIFYNKIQSKLELKMINRLGRCIICYSKLKTFNLFYCDLCST